LSKGLASGQANRIEQCASFSSNNSYRRGAGVGRSRGVGVILGVVVGVAVAVEVGVALVVGVAVTVGVTVTVGVDVAVGVGVGLSHMIIRLSTLQPWPEPLESLPMRHRSTMV